MLHFKKSSSTPWLGGFGSTLELRLALFEKGSDTFLCISMHEQEWEAIDRVAHFIATEAAAEGVNLQFCSLVVNYDLPWNPQRVEQRIGRCHRYGQKHDVVVISGVMQKGVKLGDRIIRPARVGVADPE